MNFATGTFSWTMLGAIVAAVTTVPSPLPYLKEQASSFTVPAINRQYEEPLTLRASSGALALKAPADQTATCDLMVVSQPVFKNLYLSRFHDSISDTSDVHPINKTQSDAANPRLNYTVQQLSEIYEELALGQEPLGSDFEAVWDANIDILYET
jgi:hypothetical protein